MEEGLHMNKPCYIRGEYTELKNASVNIQTHALQYGTAIFGGIRGYYNAERDNIYLFRLEEHFARLKNSARIMQMKMPVSYEEFREIILNILRNGEWKENVYLRPFLYKKDLSLSPRLHNVSDDLAIYALPLNDYLDTDNGLHAMVSSYVRISDNQIATRAKASGGYVNSALAKSEALENGFDEAIFLDTQGFVSEGSAENIFIVRDDELITPDIASSILEGITRRTLMEVALRKGIPVVERRVTRSELYTADEAFFAGTGVQLAWIKSIDRREVGSGEMGEVTAMLKKEYFSIVKGEVREFESWLTPVY